jgi:hypothetical protein
VQFSCLALDASDEFLAAGGQDFFDVYLWSMKLGILLEVCVFRNLIMSKIKILQLYDLYEI